MTIVRIKQNDMHKFEKKTEVLNLSAMVYITRRLGRHGDKIFIVGS